MLISINCITIASRQCNVWPVEQFVPLGFAAHISCQFKGSVSWTLNNDLLKSNNTYMAQGYLLILSVSPAMYGKYSCYGKYELHTKLLGSSLLHRKPGKCGTS